MLTTLAKVPTQAAHCTILLHNPISLHLPFSTRLNFRTVLGNSQNGFFCNAAKTKKNGTFSPAEMDGPDEEFEDDEFVVDDEFEGEDDEEFEDDVFDDDDEFEGEVVIPLKNMKTWAENRPRGFGEGKVYDTSIEDELMEEIEKGRNAQLANLNKLKNNPVKEGSKLDKGSTQVQEGFPVRLVNLPKKKNIHRDLRVAFKEVPGILNIVPIVSGNEKTRDPVCKGVALIHFKHKKEAARFVENFSGTSISFGKVQKQIKCELMSPKLPKPASDQSLDESYQNPPKAPAELNYTDGRHVSAEWESYDAEINGALTTSDSDSADELINVGEDTSVDSSSMNQIRQPKANEKKVASKKKKDKVPKGPKLNIPGSANRLKIREKEMLTGVFSKYRANATLTVKEQSR